jgi:eukaryotic-like serine/threonine-protein kinase
MRSIDLGDVSLEPTSLSALSREQQERLADVLDRYLSSLDDAVPINREALIEAHPDLAEPLAGYLDRLEELHDAAAGFAGGNKNATEPPAEGDTDKRIGDFQLVREIGRGGMGVVYEAWQVSLGRRVALKVLPFAAVLDSKQIARFRNEAQAAAQLHHSNIVPVFAVGVERGVHFYAMQFIDGQPLDQAIDQLREESGGNPSRQPDETAIYPQPKVGITASAETLRCDRTTQGQGSLLKHSFANRGSFHRLAVRLGIEAAEALHAAHEYGVIHRDVKPSNLLLDAEGKLWVTDFGLARFQSNASLTKTGDLVGTMRYMSPEQAAGRAAMVDQRTDVYSLGATLYELITLRHAFEGDDGPTLLKKIDQEEPRPLRQLQPRAPADLETVIHKAMAKAPAERYQTAKDFADDLRRVLDGQPTLAKPPSVVDRLTKWTRRHRNFVVGAALLMLASIVSLSVATALVVREKNKAEANYELAIGDYRTARTAVDELGLEMAQRLANEPGATHFRRDLLGAAIKYYRHFIEKAKEDPRRDDPAVIVDMALAFENIGKLTQNVDGSAESLVYYRESQRLLESVVAQYPNHEDHDKHRQSLGIVLNNLGVASGITGRFDEAYHALNESISIRSALVSADSTNATYRGDLALSLSNLGEIALAEGKDVASAEKLFQRALEIQKGLVEAAPKDGDALKNIAATSSNLAAVYDRRDATAALVACRHAVDYMHRALQAAPRSISFQTKLATMYSNLGAFQAKAQELDAARTSYQRAIDLLLPLHKEAAENKTFRMDLAAVYNNLGMLQAQTRQVNAAQDSFDRALEVYEPLPKMYPQDHALASSIGGVYNNVGFLLSATGQVDKAVSEYYRAIAAQSTAYRLAPQIEKYKEFLDRHYANYGQALRKLDRPEAAQKTALERGKLWQSDGRRLMAVAEELALAWKLMNGRPELAQSATKCATDVRDILEKAAKDVDLSIELADKPAFSGLIDRPEIAKLMHRAP